MANTSESVGSVGGPTARPGFVVGHGKTKGSQISEWLHHIIGVTRRIQRS